MSRVHERGTCLQKVAFNLIIRLKKVGRSCILSYKLVKASKEGYAMKSVKPGRGPSFMGGIASLFAAVFGVFWIFMTMRMGAPVIFPVFGVFFIVMGLVQAAYNFANASSKNRFSEFDIVDSKEEPDPMDAGSSAGRSEAEDGSFRFCPYCGRPLDSTFAFCPECGKKLG